MAGNHNEENPLGPFVNGDGRMKPVQLLEELCKEFPCIGWECFLYHPPFSSCEFRGSLTPYLDVSIYALETEKGLSWCIELNAVPLDDLIEGPPAYRWEVAKSHIKTMLEAFAKTLKGDQ